jgi:hypothetical protein
MKYVALAIPQTRCMIGPLHTLAGTRPGNIRVTGCGLDLPEKRAILCNTLTHHGPRCGECLQHG